MPRLPRRAGRSGTEPVAMAARDQLRLVETKRPPGSLETFRKSGRGAAAGAACLPDLILLGRAGLKGRGRTSQAELWPEVVADAGPELDHTLSHDLLEPCRAAIDGDRGTGRRHRRRPVGQRPITDTRQTGRTVAVVVSNLIVPPGSDIHQTSGYIDQQPKCGSRRRLSTVTSGGRRGGPGAQGLCLEPAPQSACHEVHPSWRQGLGARAAGQPRLLEIPLASDPAGACRAA